MVFSPNAAAKLPSYNTPPPAPQQQAPLSRVVPMSQPEPALQQLRIVITPPRAAETTHMPHSTTPIDDAIQEAYIQIIAEGQAYEPESAIQMRIQHAITGRSIPPLRF